MKTKKSIAAAGILTALSLSGCVTTQVASLQSKSDQDIQVFLTTLPDKPYTEVTYIEASGAVFHNKKQLMKQLKKRAVKEGADALISVKYDYQFWWPYVDGIAIKYQDQSKTAPLK